MWYLVSLVAFSKTAWSHWLSSSLHLDIKRHPQLQHIQHLQINAPMSWQWHILHSLWDSALCLGLFQFSAWANIQSDHFIFWLKANRPDNGDIEPSSDQKKNVIRYLETNNCSAPILLLFVHRGWLDEWSSRLWLTWPRRINFFAST